MRTYFNSIINRHINIWVVKINFFYPNRLSEKFILEDLENGIFLISVAYF